MSGPESGHGTRRAIFAAFLANLGIAGAKFAAFLITGSASMMAESIHSVADTGNQGLLFLGGARARRPADSKHQFGHGPERYFWAFVVALVLFSLGALFSLYEGVDKLRHPHSLESPAIAFVVLGVAVVLESLSLRTAVRESQPHRGGRSWWQFIRQTKTPELPVVLLEDVGALFGLVFAAVGLGLAVGTGETRYDAIGSIAIGLLLGAIAVVLAVEMKSALIGESADPAVAASIWAAIESGSEVRRVIHLRTLQLGPDDVLVAAKLDIDAPDIAGLAAAIDTIEVRIRATEPMVRLIYIEPDLYRAEAAEPGPGAGGTLDG
ncbi:MAG: cation diffusion facilitator family transporter [Acidimicrobiia bacterium]